MPELSRFQHGFAAALNAPARRPTPMQIYRNTALLGAVEALQANFPSTRAVVGKRIFDALAVAHARAFPPDSPVLALYGERFPEWLEGEQVARRLPYLCDVARCDRLWMEALHAADAEPLAFDSLADRDGDSLLDLRLRLHPATRFAWQASAARAVWQAQRDGRGQAVRPDWRATGVLFTRPSLAVEAVRIDAATHRLLSGIRLAEKLGQAAGAASALYPDADVGARFAQLVQLGAFAALSPERPRP